jgi:protein TonB
MSFSKEFPQKRLFTHRFISPLTSLMNPRVEINRTYKKELKISLIVSLFFLLFVFNVLPKQLIVFKGKAEVETIDLVVEDIPRTEQIHRPPPPARPVVPIPTEDEDVPEDLTIESSEVDFAELPPPPQPPQKSDDEGYHFIAYDSAPEPVGGFAAILRHIKYPDIARRAGVECDVIVGAFIDKNGNCIKTVMLKDTGSELGFEAAAQQAVMKVKWKPALQRDTPIEVWVSVPVSFRLNERSQ